jgi:hypothetical protein
VEGTIKHKQQRKWGGPRRYVVRSGRNVEAERRIQSKDTPSGLGRVEQDVIVASEKGNVELAGPGCSRLGSSSDQPGFPDGCGSYFGSSGRTSPTTSSVALEYSSVGQW